MSIENLIIAVYCLIDDEEKKMLHNRIIRQRGPQPVLKDSEVITIEIVGEFIGKDSDKSIWEYFNGHWKHFFPKIPDRSNFAKQAAKLHVVKRLLQQHLAAALGAFEDSLHIVDGLPMPLCKFARAHFSRVFKGDAAYGYCAAKKERYYGFRGHILINTIGVITAATFTPANVDEREVCRELVEKINGMLLGDKGYMRPELKTELAENGVYLETPLRGNMNDERPKSFLNWMVSTRRLIETVIGQLTERFHIEKIRARDMWHQAARFWRKILAHTACIMLNLTLDNEPLQFEKLANY